MSLINYFKSKKVLVAGGTGFVGTNLIKKLLPLGVEVTATYHKTNPFAKKNDVKYVNSNLLDPKDCFKLCKNIDFIFMCAANTSGAKIIAATPLVHLTPNIIMNINMLDAAYKANVEKFLFISSNTVYPLKDGYVKEHDVTNQFYESYHIVAWMKRFTEIVCDMYANKIKEPMKTIVIRPGNLYGPHDKFDLEKSKVIPALLRRAVERKNPFIVWGDGLDLKDFLYIDDFIDGLILAMKNLNDFEPINLASGKPVTIRDVLGQILIATGYNDARIKYDLSKPKMIPKRMIDISLAKKRLNWAPKFTLKKGITNTLSWYQRTLNTRAYKDIN